MSDIANNIRKGAETLLTGKRAQDVKEEIEVGEGKNKKGGIAKHFIYVILGILLFFGLKFIIKKQLIEFGMYIQFLGAFMPYMGILMALVGVGRAFKHSKWAKDI